MKKLIVSILKNVAEGAKDTAFGMVPGSSIVVEGIIKLFDKDNSNNTQGLMEIEEGVTTALQNLAPEHVSDVALLAQGIKELKAAFEKIRSALKH